MAIATKTVQEPYLDASKLNTTFQWTTLLNPGQPEGGSFDTQVISASVISGSADVEGSDPQFTIETSHDLLSWTGSTTLNHNADSSEISIVAPHYRVRTTTENSTAFRVAINVELRKDT